jgi:predicted RNase H-like HicB family nuclease
MSATIGIVDAYVVALVHRMEIEALEEGGFVATVPEARGIIADGDTLPQCIEDLVARLERWVRDWSTRGVELPVVDGINLNTPENRALVGYHKGSEPRPVAGEFFEDSESFLADMERRARSA